MGMRLPLASALALLLVFSACSTTPDESTTREPAVATAGWESPGTTTARIPAAAPTRAQVASTVSEPPADDLSSLRDMNTRLREDVSRLTDEVRTMRDSRPEPDAEMASEPVRPGTAASAQAGGDAIRRALRSAGAGDLVVTTNREGRVIVTLEGAHSFAPGRAELTPQARANLAKLGAVLGRELGDRRFRVEGHTDSDPIRKSNWASNEALSAARAAAVADCLTSEGGLGADRVESIGYGASRPVTANDSVEGKARNRRVEIVILP